MKYLFATLLLTTRLFAFDMPVEEVRERINNKCMSIEAEVPEVGLVRNCTIDTTPVRIYTPARGDHHPLILLIHGGAFVAGNLDTHDNLARYLCKHTDATVLSVGYSTAPEAKFPSQLEQCYAALMWAAAHTEGPLAIVGDSAGGNMGAALSLMARDRAGPKIAIQVLINPAPDLTLSTLRWQALAYVQRPEEVYHPYVSPALAGDLTNLPPTLVLVAELDDLRESGERFAERLRAADVPTELYCQMGINHLAGDGARASNLAMESLTVATTALRDAFEGAVDTPLEQLPVGL